jgi:nickel transport protein
MTRHLTRTGLALLLGFVPYTSHAHGVWLEMQHGELAVVYGHGAEEDAYDPAKLTSIMVCPGGTDCAAAPTVVHETHVTLPMPDAASVITAAFDNGYWSKDAAGEWQNSAMDLVPGATEGGQYLKHVVYLSGPIDGLKPMGLPLEIVPLADPFAMKAGDMLPVQVLMNGKPMPGAEITADYVNATDAAAIVADADGKAMVPLRNQGLNVLSASASEPHPEPAKAQEIGHTATLSFMLAHAGE